MASVALISLGCEKNLVNSEQMLWMLSEAGFEICQPENADVVIVNTCGFIDSAKSEAIDNILALDAMRKKGCGFKIIVTGCLAQRYPDEIFSELPEVDGIVGCGSFDSIVEAARAALDGERPCYMGSLSAPVSETPRLVTTPRWYSYLRIAEGCDNYCAYCVIPYLRGPYRSRKMEDILNEARSLAQSGTKELIVIAQDVTRYGKDLTGGEDLPALLEKLCEIEGIEWIRLHYLYPDEFTPRLLDVMAGQQKILPYFDIPLQHINDTILKRMNRRSSKTQIETLLRTIRQKLPEAVIRTSIICGLPGESEMEFEELCDFLKEFRLQRAGFFVFSPEEGTPAAEMPDQVPRETAEERVSILQQLQDGIMAHYNESRVGSVMRVICDGYDEDRGEYYGRTAADSPTVDEQVYFTSEEPVQPGDIIDFRAEYLRDGELAGTRV